MTAEDKKKLIQACKLIKQVFPNMCGNIKFHLHPEQQKVIIGVDYSVMIQPKEYQEG